MLIKIFWEAGIFTGIFIAYAVRLKYRIDSNSEGDDES
jgi:hypothetical protein